MDTYLERMCVALERIADNLEGCNAGVGDPVGKPRGRPRKVATVDPVPPETPKVGEVVPAAAAAPALPNPPATAAEATPAAPPTTVTASTATSVHSLEELQKIVAYLCSKGKSVEVKKVFTDYGTQRASGIPAEQRDAAFEDMKKLVPPVEAT